MIAATSRWPMRVLVWSEGFWPYIGGIQVASRHLLPALRRRGCEIAVITAHRNLDLPDEERYDGIRVHRFPFYRALERCDLDELAAVLRAVARLKRTFRPDLIHVNSIGQCLLFHLRTARAHRAPELLTLHVEPPAGSLRRETVVGAALRSADWVTACSEAVLREARRQAPEFEPRSSVIHYGLPAPTLDPSPLPFDPPRLLCLGRLVPRKGLDLAIRALALLARRMPAARLVVAGAGPLRTALQELAAELDVGDRVEFLGSIPPGQVLALINTATLLVLPSRYEGMPLVAIEAAQMGRPTVATRVSGLPELILDGVTGLLVAPDDAAALAAAVVALLERPEQARRMGEAARQLVLDRFGLDRSADAYLGRYEALVAPRTRPAASSRPA